ncbi:uncharacterized protein METZ01_LOCUS174673 [marine metagenome]|uniref:Uncharacterized protein n=1 Tax=marine metagenome TaxID=408172 RepID=A0A382C7H7_9ZZZZ
MLVLQNVLFKYIQFSAPNDRLWREPDCEELVCPSAGEPRQK